MAEEANDNPAAQEPHGDQQPPTVDYEAKYREAVAHSREWEKRAKDNKAAADELEQLKQSQMSEAEKAAAKTARLQKELDQLKAEKQSNDWRSQVVKESGLPASLIVGDSLEAMQAHAKAINDYVATLTKPHVTAPGESNRQETPTGSGDWLRDQYLHNN